jgi:hypothetical protein
MLEFPLPAFLETLHFSYTETQPLPFLGVFSFARALFAGDFQNVQIVEGFVIISILAILVFQWGLRSLEKMAS